VDSPGEGILSKTMIVPVGKSALPWPAVPCSTGLDGSMEKAQARFRDL
jgi:hypothetical protein